MSNYAFRKGKFLFVFEVVKMVKKNYRSGMDIILPTEKFPFGALFTHFGKAGFAAVLEDGTYYISCHNSYHNKNRFFFEGINFLENEAEYAQKLTAAPAKRISFKEM